MKVEQSLQCPHCYGAKVVKNGHKKNGTQTYLCKNCDKQFQDMYLYWGAEKRVKSLALRMLIRGSGISDIAYVLSISQTCVLQLLEAQAGIELKPRQSSYDRVQVDELYSFVGSKKKKVWILYAYCADTKEILALIMGKRSKKTVKDLLNRMKNIQVNFWCTDNWKAFKEVFHSDYHLVGKKFTKAIEGVNTSLRNSCKRLIRKTTAFSKKLLNHWCAVKLAMYHRNLNLSYI